MYAYTLTRVRIPKLLRAAKASSNLSHRALAARSGVATSTITRIQAGRLAPTVEVLERIVAACGYRLELRLTRTDTLRPPHLDDLCDAWSFDGERLRLTWTRWRAWLDTMALHPELVPEAIYAPPLPSGHPVVDSLLAGVAEKLADDHGLVRPAWTSTTPAADPPFRPPARTSAAPPEQLAARGLLIDEASLFRPSHLLDA